MNRLFRPTVRLRLTLTYGALFLVTGALLLGLLYALLSRALDPGPPKQFGNGSSQSQGQGPNGGSEGGGADEPPFTTPVAGETRTTEQQVDDARREERQSALRQVQIYAGIALVVSSALSLIAGWIIAGRVMRPVRDITLHARHASEETLGERINLQGPADELKELADTIDGMLDRLQSAFDSQRRFSAEASHELRTPIAIIRAEVDVALAAPDVTEREHELGTTIRTAADRSERLIDGLLMLARSESTLLDMVRVDLAGLVGDVVGEQARAADAAGVELDLELDTAIVDGDRALLWRLIGNLVENAIRYNTRGGWVRVTIAPVRDQAVLTVANGGVMVETESIGQLFEPFQRGALSRRTRNSGVGLGMTIVRSVTAAHNGTVEANANPEGGLTVVVRIPLAPQLPSTA
ncbi:MAG: sensor histidine kinase [Thermomicrobiales bacterium]